MLSEKADKIFKMKYQRGNENWATACFRVANYIASVEETEEKRLEYEKKFLELIYNKVFIPGGRTLANAGTNIKNLLNCFVLPIEDSREGIYSALKDSAEIFAHGGGIGFDFSDIREEGAPITTTGGFASGPISFMGLFDQTGEVIQQASRRGAQIGFLSIDHPDIEKFINYKSTPNTKNRRLLSEYKRNLRHAGLKDDGHTYFKVLEKTLQDDQLSHFNISISLTDEFMMAVSKNENFKLKSRGGKVDKEIKARKLLRQIAEMAWESGDPGVAFLDRVNEDNMVPYMGKLAAANPCVTGDTKILTVYDGPVSIKELAEKNEDVLVYAWNPVTKLPVVRVMRNPRLTQKDAEVMEIGFDSGLKVKCTPDHEFFSFRGGLVQARHLRIGQSLRAYAVELHKDGHLRVLGYSNKKVKHEYVSRLVWKCFNGEIEENLILHHRDLDKLNNRLENMELLTNSEHSSLHHSKRQNHKITSITFLNEKEDVYNGTVDDVHNYIIADPEPVYGVYSGIVSKNCGEIYLLPYEACCLGSLNLHAFYEKETNSINYEFLEYAVRTAIRFLDNVQEISTLPIEEIDAMCKGLRRLGLGVFGWADLLAELEIPYNSPEAMFLGNRLSWFISFFGWMESMALVSERGVFPMYDAELVNLNHLKSVINSKFNTSPLDIEEVRKHGVRNIAITSIAPTGTIAILADVNSGIEPFFALAYKRNITEGVGNTAKDHIIEVNPILMRKLENLNFEPDKLDEIKKKILKTGSIQNIPEIPEKLRAAFLVANEISPTAHVEMQSYWQQYIDNSISKTCNLPENSTVEDIENIFIDGWNRNLKGLTVYRNNSKSFQILNAGVK